VKRLRLLWLKIIKEMHRKIKSALIFCLFCIKAKEEEKRYIELFLFEFLNSLMVQLSSSEMDKTMNY